MDIKYLKKNEILHEIFIRNFKVVGTEDVSELRSILRELIKSNKPISNEKFTLTNEIIAEIQTTLTEVQKVIDEYPGKDAKATRIRVKSRLAHVLDRIDRLDRTKEDSEQIIDNFRDTCVRLGTKIEVKEKKLVKSMCSTFMGETAIPPLLDDGSSDEEDSSSSMEIEENPLRLPSANAPVVARASNQKSGASVYKWGVAFKGIEKPEAVMTFLERVEELRIARNVSKSNLFVSAVDLFTGDAVAWYRSVKNKVSSWDELLRALKTDFLPPDFDDTVWDEIRNRKQNRGEKVSMFIAVMENLFSRLATPANEDVKLRIIKKNLLPVYISRLSLTVVHSLEELGFLCRMIEGTLNYKNTVTEMPKSGRICALGGRQLSVKCWNCGQEGHRYSQCREERKKFCQKCGTPDKTTRTCDKCKKN